MCPGCYPQYRKCKKVVDGFNLASVQRALYYVPVSFPGVSKFDLSEKLTVKSGFKTGDSEGGHGLSGGSVMGSVIIG